MATSLEEIIKTQTALLDQQKTNYEKLSIAFNLIEMKVESNNELLMRDLFLDAKNMISYYVHAIDESHYGYYVFSTESSNKILEKVAYFKSEEQISLIELLQRRLRLSGFNDEADFFEKKIAELRLSIYAKKLSFINLVRCVGILSTRSIMALFISILIIYFFYTLLLLEAPYEFMVFFEIKYQSYSSNYLGNHFLNTLISFCQIDSDFEIKPRNFGGVFLLIFLKGSILALLFNFLINELKKKIKL